MKTAVPAIRLPLGGFSLALGVFLIGLPIVLAPSALAQARAQAENGNTANSQDLDAEIASWIRKLGNPNYAVRLQAQSELERIGVRALDQLHQASFHENPQIASQARYLVQSNQFNWAWETDPFNVRRILSNYTTAPLYEKSVYIDQLQSLEGDEGLPALCRLIRFETQGCLAKRAALLVMRGKPQLGQTLEERKAWIASMLDGAMSHSGGWILDFANQSATFSPKVWLDRIEDERKLLQAKSPDTSVEIISELRRWLVEQIADDPTHREQSLEIARQVPEYFSGSDAGNSSVYFEFAQWALQAGLPEIVREQHARLSDLQLRDPRFGYLLAESYELGNDGQRASRIAEWTALRQSVDASGDPTRPGADRSDETALQRRLAEMRQRDASLVFERSAIGEFLIQRGRFDWAERELRSAIDGHEDSAELSTIYNLSLLSQMLHELSRDKEAADVLERYTVRFEREPLFRTQVSEQGGGTLVSNYYLYRGDSARAERDLSEAREMYLKSIEASHENVDAIIGLYRLDDSSPGAIQERKELQRRVASELRQEIDERERDLKRENPRFQATEQRSLANQMNTLAWLIANTEGNQEEALHLSRKACSIYPNNSAYLDTLAHCYASLNRYRDAVEQQRRAVALEPHQPSLVANLKRFESKLAEEAAGK